MTELQILLNAANFIAERIKEEFVKQGHSMTQEWENNVIAEEDNDNSASVWAYGYGLVLNEGVTADRIPFGGNGTSSNTESKYILGLVRFAKLRKPGISDKQALRMAFAIANVQKMEGMPTDNSFQYSTTTERKGFIAVSEILYIADLDDKVFDGLCNIVEEQASKFEQPVLIL